MLSKRCNYCREQLKELKAHQIFLFVAVPPIRILSCWMEHRYTIQHISLDFCRSLIRTFFRKLKLLMAGSLRVTAGGCFRFLMWNRDQNSLRAPNGAVTAG